MLEAYQEELCAQIKAGNTEMKVGKEEIKTIVRASQKNMDAAINSIRSELEKTIKNRMEDILATVGQGAQGLHEEVNAKPEETKPGSHGVTLTFHMSTKNLRKETEDTKGGPPRRAPL
jgi:(p)ppGpp synthase/HD superfamily hydrolase